MPAMPATAPSLLLAQPRGFCAGVVRAISVVEQALALYGAPVCVFHEIVHNGHVVQGLRARGVVFVERIDSIPERAVAVFSAHGVAHSVVDEASARQLRSIDATCPLVAKVQAQAQRDAQAGRTVLVDDTRDIIAVLQQRFPGIQGPALADICYASQNRQAAVRQMARQADGLLVVGARNSSNACRLREVGEQQGLQAWLVEDASQIDPAWLQGLRCIGVTAGASTPEHLVQAVCARLRSLGVRQVRQLPGQAERVRFALPAGLERLPASAPALTA